MCAAPACGARAGSIVLPAAACVAVSPVMHTAPQQGDPIMRQRRFHSSFHPESLESRVHLSGTRSYDGTGNNLTHLTWGAVGEMLLRRTPA